MTLSYRILYSSTAIGLCLIITVLGSGVHFPLTAENISISRGEAIFRARCSSCHSVGNQSQKFGPDLSLIGAIAATRVESTSAETYLLESIMSPEKFKASDGIMPANLADDLSKYEVMSIVAYLQSLGGESNFSQILKLDIKSYRTDSSPAKTELLDIGMIEQGRDLFYNTYKCGVCHQVQALPGRAFMAPNLAGIGYQTADYLKQAIRNPSSTVHSEFKQTRFLLEDGRQINGILLSATNSSLILLRSMNNGGYQPYKLRKDDVITATENSRSTMPVWDSTSMTETQLEKLIAFLKTLR